MNIRKTVNRLKKIHGTSNPFLIAKEKGILVIYEDLGSINGYYNMVFRQKQIHINSKLNKLEQTYTAAHELGHAIMHPNVNTPFLRNNTFLSIDKHEIEADKFAINLLISDDYLQEYKDYSVEQLSKIFGYHVQLIKLRLSDIDK